MARSSTSTRTENTAFRRRKVQPVEERLHVDIPLSRREVTNLRRTRTLATVRWIVGGTVTLLALGWSHSLWARAFRENPSYAVGQYEFKTNGLMSPRLATQATGLNAATNLMDVDLKNIRQKLVDMPRVKSATVERRLPDRLVVSVEERLPIAWILCEKQGLRQSRNGILIDRDGIAFRCEDLLREYLVLPGIQVTTLPAPVVVGERLDHPPIEAALAVMAALSQREGKSSQAVRAVSIPNDWTVHCKTTSGITLTFHAEGVPEQLERLRVIEGIARRRGRQIASVDLQMKRNVPVTFFDQPALDAAPTRPPAKPMSTRTSQDIQTILRGQ
jgi:cell division protein FtsQ